MFSTTLFVLGSALGLLYLYLKHKNNYWQKRGLVSPKALPVLGNYANYIMLKKNLGETVTDICNQFPKEPIIGAYYGTEPVVILKDPELIKLALIKDFYYFSSRDFSGHVKKETSMQNVFLEEGDNWRILRQNLTPLFSSAKMKKMFHLIENRTQDFEKFLAKALELNHEHEVRSFMAKYTMDCIGSCIFGVETKVMEGGNDNPFKVISEKIFDFVPRRVFKIILRNIWTNTFYKFGLTTVSNEVYVFFKTLIVGVFNARDNTPSSRNDFIDFILGFKNDQYIIGDSIRSLKNQGEVKETVQMNVDDEMLVSQCFIFFVAGFETSAVTMSFTLYELSKHPDNLQQVLDEVDQYLAKTGGKITYDCVSELPYLVACINEALRLYPVLGVITRQVVEDYKMPSGVVLEKNVRVHVPVHYIHKNPEYFPEPEEFRPERFMGDNKRDIKPYTYFPFGEGPRFCIGMRFAWMQMMAGLVCLFKTYSVELPADMPRTVEFEPLSIITQTKTRVHLKFVPRITRKTN